jgi:predicted RNA binding protein YcfA (HicA-like mRNA interferase family)
MPRGVFNWTADDVIRFLRDNGFAFSHSQGSHWFYIGSYGGRRREVTVLFHGAKAIKPRTLKGMIRQSGIPKEEWLKWR